MAVANRDSGSETSETDEDYDIAAAKIVDNMPTQREMERTIIGDTSHSTRVVQTQARHTKAIHELKNMDIECALQQRKTKAEVEKTEAETVEAIAQAARAAQEQKAREEADAHAAQVTATKVQRVTRAFVESAFATRKRALQRLNDSAVTITQKTAAAEKTAKYHSAVHRASSAYGSLPGHEVADHDRDLVSYLKIRMMGQAINDDYIRACAAYARIWKKEADVTDEYLAAVLPRTIIRVAERTRDERAMYHKLHEYRSKQYSLTEDAHNFISLIRSEGLQTAAATLAKVSGGTVYDAAVHLAKAAQKYCGK
jgi:hypothetical protein